MALSLLGKESKHSRSVNCDSFSFGMICWELCSEVREGQSKRVMKLNNSFFFFHLFRRLNLLEKSRAMRRSYRE